MPEQAAPWNDEAFAGSLFPAARPIPAKWIATSFGPVASVAAHTATQEARAAAREAARQAAGSPEAREAAWHEAREQVRREMRHERQQERIAAGIEEPSPEPDYVRYCEEWVEDVRKAMLPALSGIAQGFAAMAQSPPFVVNITPGAWIAFNGATPMHLPTQTVSAEEWAASLANGGWFPPPGHEAARERAVKSMDAFAAPLRAAPKPRLERERYLPGTRHAGRGLRRCGL